MGRGQRSLPVPPLPFPRASTYTNATAAAAASLSLSRIKKSLCTKKQRSRRNQESLTDDSPPLSPFSLARHLPVDPPDPPAAEGSTTSVAAAEMAAQPGNPRRFLVGGHRYYVVVTNRLDEAEEWFQRLLPAPPDAPRVFGCSFHRSEAPGLNGIIARPVDCIHLCFLARVLVYHLTSAEGGLLSALVMRALRDPDNYFVGDCVDAALENLFPFDPLLAPRLDLFEVAELCGVAHLAGGRGNQPGPPPLHVRLARAVLGIPDGKLREDGGGEPWAWPLTQDQVEFAVQTSAVAQSLAHRVSVLSGLP